MSFPASAILHDMMRMLYFGGIPSYGRGPLLLSVRQQNFLCL